MNPNCNRDPLTCRCWYHQGHVDEPPETTKPVVTQADDGLALFIARIHDLTPNGEWIRVKHHPNGDWSIDHGPLTDAAHSSQAVVSQDLVPVADKVSALPLRDRATAAEPVVSALRDGIPSADSYAGWQQSRGMLADKVDWAIHEYDEFMKDDAYDAQRVLDRIIKGLRQIRDDLRAGESV